MTPHISAKKSDIAKIVLMPGDPLRAKYIANKYLQNVKQVSNVRNMLIFTGKYKNKLVTIASSGMGCPSIGIYSYELFKFYDVDVIIRIGSAGSYSSNLKLMDILNVEKSYSNSCYAKDAINMNEKILPASIKLHNLISDVAKKLDYKIYNNAFVHCSDVFYSDNKNLYKDMLLNYGTQAVEMETFALFTNAIRTNKHAACLLTITDSFTYHKSLSAKERETKLNNSIFIALEAILYL